MATQMDYVAALAIFFISFVAAVSMIVAHAEGFSGAMETNAMRLYAENLLAVADREWSGEGTISSAGIGTKAYFFELTAAGDGIVQFPLSNLSTGADANSFAIYKKGHSGSVPYSLSGDRISFATNGSSGFVVWYDDDSSFPSRSSHVEGTAVSSTMWQAEESTIISAGALQRISQLDYSSVKEMYDFQISIVRNGETEFAYGAMPEGDNIIVAERPVLFQEQDADVAEGRLVVKVW